jgi:hypothetical protein
LTTYSGHHSSNHRAPQNHVNLNSPYPGGHYPSSSQQQTQAGNGRIDTVIAEPSAPPLEAAITHAGEAPPAYHTVVRYKTVDLDTHDEDVRLSKDVSLSHEHPTSTLTEPSAPPAYII